MRLAATLFLLGFALDSSALTIGRPQGAAWIGKPLNMVVPLSLEASEPADSLCLEAEVVQGDARMPDRRVTASLEPGSGPNTPHMRIRTTTAVEEPVLTVTVRAGCDARSVRTYAVLADPPIEPPALAVRASPTPGTQGMAALPPAAAPSIGTGAGGQQGGVAAAATVRPQRRDAAPGPRARARNTDAAASRREALRTPIATRRGDTTVASRTSAGALRSAQRTPSRTQNGAMPVAPASGPRLRLAPVELVAEGLKVSPQLISSEDPSQRAEAAAQWLALEAGSMGGAPADLAQRTQALEAELAALRAQDEQAKRTVSELRSELAQARESRHGNLLVYLLSVLLLLAVAASAWFWQLARQRGERAWWRETVQPPAADESGWPAGRRDLLDDDEAMVGGMPAHASPADDDDDDLVDLVEPHLARLNDGAQERPVNTEELYDVQQQSDFFLSLGQHEQAIGVLQTHIAANPDTSPLVYLDLLRIFQSMGRRGDYARLANDFEHVFNAEVPAFDRFSDSAGRGLEHYPGTLARIASKWPAPGTLALIEELVFRKPGVAGERSFELAAYQELLLLYSVARDVIEPAEPNPAFVDTIDPRAAPTMRLSPGAKGGSIDSTGAAIRISAAPEPLDLAEFDRTAYETVPSVLEPPAAEQAETLHEVDIELFDPAVEAMIAPRPSRH